jgi:hypothetical protein
MRLWHIFQNDRSHDIVTHQVGTKFLRKKKKKKKKEELRKMFFVV